MRKFNIGIFGILGILVLVVFASGCVSSDNNTSNNSQSSSGQSSQSSSSSNTGNAMVKVIATGPWTGQVQDSAGSRSVSGTGSQTIQIANSGTVGASIQKDNSNDAFNNETGAITPDTSTLTVQIVDGSGNVVETQSTSTDAGLVTVTHNF